MRFLIAASVSEGVHHQSELAALERKVGALLRRENEQIDVDPQHGWLEVIESTQETRDQVLDVLAHYTSFVTNVHVFSTDPDIHEINLQQERRITSLNSAEL